MNGGCHFCKIKEGKADARIVYEDDHALAFLDINPRAPGHAMVIPKQHAATILDLSDAEIGPFFSAVKKVAGKALAGVAAEGLTIGINHGSVSGQVVEHLHVHVIPRFAGDRGGSVQSVVDNPPQEALDEWQKKILSAQP